MLIKTELVNYFIVNNIFSKINTILLFFDVNFDPNQLQQLDIIYFYILIKLETCNVINVYQQEVINNQFENVNDNYTAIILHIIELVACYHSLSNILELYVRSYKTFNKYITSMKL